MQAEEIEAYLAELGQELQNMGIQDPLRILMIGGAFMLTQVHNRETTNDIDILFVDIDDPSTSPTYQVFKEAARAVAGRHHLPFNWINDVVSDFLREVGAIPAGTLWHIYGALHISLPPKDYILAHKILAGREKDKSDIRALAHELGITTRAQAQAVVDRYISNKQLQQLSDLDDTLDVFFSPE